MQRARYQAGDALQRVLLQAAACNIGLLLRHQTGVGTPRSLQGRAVSAICRLIGRLIDCWGPLRRLWGFKWTPTALVGSIAHRQAALNSGAQRTDFFHGLLTVTRLPSTQHDNGGRYPSFDRASSQAHPRRQRSARADDTLAPLGRIDRVRASAGRQPDSCWSTRQFLVRLFEPCGGSINKGAHVTQIVGRRPISCRKRPTAQTPSQASQPHLHPCRRMRPDLKSWRQSVAS